MDFIYDNAWFTTLKFWIFTICAGVFSEVLSLPRKYCKFSPCLNNHFYCNKDCRTYRGGQVFHVIVAGDGTPPPLKPRGVRPGHLLCHKLRHVFCLLLHLRHFPWIVHEVVNLIHIWSLCIYLQWQIDKQLINSYK